MRTGRLDRTVNLQRLTETVNAAGTVSTVWTTFATVRAELVSNLLTETGYAFGEADTDALVFRIRYRSGLTTTDRLTYEGRAYNLVGIVETGRRRALELRCEAVK
jgi:SPP1 family predicted phage head-tail adaptor